MKPHPRSYELAADYVGFPVSKCLFIDDREDNIDGARAVGMPAIHFLNPDDLRHHLQVAGILP
jgi:putative hydrolase of the HAD superfamily